MVVRNKSYENIKYFLLLLLFTVYCLSINVLISNKNIYCLSINVLIPNKKYYFLLKQ